MSFVQAARHQLRLNALRAPRRCLASQSAPAPAAHAAHPTTKADGHTASPAKSSCTENTVLVGLNYLKGQPEVMALPDDAYPRWLWSLLNPKALPDDGPGGKAEKVRLRKANRQRIREQNFLKTQ